MELVRDLLSKSAVAEHQHEAGHNFFFENITVIGKCVSLLRLTLGSGLVVETSEIKFRFGYTVISIVQINKT